MLGAVTSVALALVVPALFSKDAGFAQLCLLMAIQETLLIGLPALLLMMRSPAAEAHLKTLWAKPDAYKGGLVMLMAVAFTLVSVLITVIFLSVLQSFGVKPPEGVALVPENWQQLLMAMLCATLLPAVAEELLFRGLIQGGLAARFKPTLAIWVSALLFAILHRSLLAFPQMLAIGLVLGSLRQHSGGLWLPIIFHTFYNAAVLILNYTRTVPSLGMMLVCTAVFTVSYRLLMKEGANDAGQGNRV